MQSVSPVLAALLLLPLTAPGVLGDELVVWLNPSEVPFVPTPTVAVALAPVPGQESCTGTSITSTGRVPHYVDYVRVETIVERCALTLAEVEWKVNGTTYRGYFDAATGVVSRITVLAQDPSPVVGASYEGDPGDAVDSIRYRKEYTLDPVPESDDDRIVRDGYTWTGRESHVWLHFWARSGSGNENVVLNYNWNYATTTRRETELSAAKCNADGIWRNTQCGSVTYEAAGQGPPGSGAHAFGAFYATVPPRNPHEWHVDVWPEPDQTPEGKCYSRGELPWFYGSRCRVGSGNV